MSCNKILFSNKSRLDKYKMQQFFLFGVRVALLKVQKNLISKKIPNQRNCLYQDLHCSVLDDNKSISNYMLVPHLSGNVLLLRQTVDKMFPLLCFMAILTKFVYV